jgi:hypothetical protein
MTERFDKVDKQFSAMANRFDGLEKLVDKVF